MKQCPKLSFHKIGKLSLESKPFKQSSNCQNPDTWTTCPNITYPPTKNTTTLCLCSDNSEACCHSALAVGFSSDTRTAGCKARKFEEESFLLRMVEYNLNLPPTDSIKVQQFPLELIQIKIVGISISSKCAETSLKQPIEGISPNWLNLPKDRQSVQN